MEFRGILSLMHYSFSAATDKSGACGMTYTEFLVDITQPDMGVMRAGPWFDMVRNKAQVQA